jgi:polyhydroxyalkanoate synthesis regulator phasin
MAENDTTEHSEHRDIPQAADVAVHRGGMAYATPAVFPAALKRVSWGAVFAGTVIAVMIYLTLSLLGLGVGLGAIDPATEADPLQGLGTGAVIGWIVTTLVALFLGGWVAGRLAGIPRSLDGILHGAVVWGLASLIAVYLTTTAVGALLSGTAATIRQAFSVAIAGVSAVAPEVAQAVTGQLEGENPSLQTILQEAAELLRQTEAPALQPENLAEQADEAIDTVQGTAQDIATSPGQAEQELEQALRRLFSTAQNMANAVDREAVVNVLVARTDMSSDDARRTVDQWIQTYQQAEAQIAEGAEEAQEAAVELSDEAADALSTAALWAFAALLLGLVAASVGGWLGIPHDVRPEGELLQHAD